MWPILKGANDWKLVRVKDSTAAAGEKDDDHDDCERVIATRADTAAARIKEGHAGAINTGSGD